MNYMLGPCQFQIFKKIDPDIFHDIDIEDSLNYVMNYM